MNYSYLIRYGLSSQVSKFASDSPELERGQTVVVRSHRGTELGEVLIKLMPSPESPFSSDPSETAPILRVAAPEDLERARQLELDRPRRFELCRGVIRDHHESVELIDVEPLLDDRLTVLHYLGPRRLEDGVLLATLRSTCDIEVLLEPVGRDIPDGPEASADEGDRGACHCGSGGGCMSVSDASHGGCSDCGIKRLLASRRALVSR